MQQLPAINEPHSEKERPWREPIYLISAITLAVFLAHLFVALFPTTNNFLGIIDEELYSGNAANLLAGKTCQLASLPYPALCNFEHPPLAKILIVPFIAIFGHVSIGWRFSSILLGTLCTPLCYMISFKISGDRKLAYLATILLSLDTLFFLQSSIAMLDVPEVFFGMAAFAIYFYGLKLGRINTLGLAGIVMGLSVLCKETGIFLAGTLMAYHIVFGQGILTKRLKESAIMIAWMVGVFAAGLQIYDMLETPFPIFTDQIAYILSFGSSDKWTYPSLLYFGYKNPFQVVNSWVCQTCWRSLTPFNWITFYSPIEYSYPPPANSTQYIILGSFRFAYDRFAYYGITNFFETWLIYIWIPIAVILLYRFRGRLGRSLQGPEKLLIFALIWFLFNYLPYIALFLESRAEFPYYIVPAIPSMALGGAYLLSRKIVPNKITIAFMILVTLWFFAFFPNKSFLPPIIHL